MEEKKTSLFEIPQPLWYFNLNKLSVQSGRLMNLQNKWIGVLGAGASGISMAKALKKLGALVTVFSDGSPQTWPLWEDFSSLIPPQHLFDATSSSLTSSPPQTIQLLCKSPGVPNEHPLVVQAKKNCLPIWTDANLAFLFSSTPLMAITGTNGKTTTTLMINQLLKWAGLKIFCGGNLSPPCCDMILSSQPYDIALWELSSFQLEYAPHLKAHYASILNISPNHLERYQNFFQYKDAKLNLLENLEPGDFFLAPESLKKELQGTAAEDFTPLIQFYTPDDLKTFEQHYDWSQFKPKGQFNRENLFVAHKMSSALLKSQGVGKREDLTQKLINTFQGVHHRLEYLGKWENLSLYNDAKSTNWFSTQEALKSFLNKTPLYLIFGGQLRKNGSHKEDLELIKKNLVKRCQKVFLVGEAAQTLHQILGKHSLLLQNLENVKDYLERNKPSGTLLFSPGFPSFDQFSSYQKRGERFKKLFTPS